MFLDLAARSSECHVDMNRRVWHGIFGKNSVRGDRGLASPERHIIPSHITMFLGFRRAVSYYCQSPWHADIP